MVKACNRCGSRNLDYKPNGVPPGSGIVLCKDCGNISTPVEFDSVHSYIAFLKMLEEGRLKEQ